MSNKVNRRDFLKIGGISTGAVLGSTLVNPIKKASALTSSDFKYRDRSDRYPWWVKEVDEPTNVYDLDSMTQWPASKLVLGNGLNQYISDDENQRIYQSREDFLKETINVPGRTLRDKALRECLNKWFFGVYFNNDLLGSLSSSITTPEQRGVKRWEGTEEEASKMIETVAKQFGAAQVAYCAIEPKWLYDHVKISSSAEPDTEENKEILPESCKYVVNMASPVPLEISKLSPNDLGSSGELAGWIRMMYAQEMIINFIKALGYEAKRLTGLQVPHAIKAGIGELGRMNRCISPIYGGGMRLGTVVTNLPLALDKPIDFGLQDFCEKCKICADVCPSGAITKDDEPSYSEYPWSMPGKEAYNDDCVKCVTYLRENSTRCGMCLVSCPWTRPNNSAMHDLSGAVGATIPGASGLLADMHGVFGYGLKNDSESANEWWDLDHPPFG